MASDNRVGVDIEQKLSETSVTAVSPSLVPVVVGVCNQIVEAVDGDGALDADALYAEADYAQASMFVPQANFPDPRDNVDELVVDPTSIQASLYFGGTLRNLARGSNGTYGTAFLALLNFSRRAALRASVASPYAFDATTGDVLTIALDVANSENVSSDITVTLVGTLTAAEVADAVNTAVGADVGSSVTVSASDYFQLTSTTFGAKSSITVRAGTSALAVLFGASFDTALEYRVEGAGLRGQDDADSDLTTPWVEFYRGDYFEDGVAQVAFPASPTANELYPGQVDNDGTFNVTKAAAVTFTGGAATVPISAGTSTVPGDQLWADGVLVGSGEVTKVETSRFKIGKLNNSLSTFDTSGVATTRVYDTVEVNTPSHSVPFAPKYAYFVANGLVYGSTTPAGEAATLTGSIQGLVARSAYVQGTGDITFPLSAASLTLDFQVTEDGVEGDEVTFTFAGGPYANIAALVAALAAEDEFDQLTVGNTGDVLLLRTTKTGADQALSLKATGTANTVLQFSAVDATADTGKDVEFATQATLVGSAISLPLTFLNGLTAELVVVDSKGTHTLSAALGASAGAAATIAALAVILDAALGSDGGVPVVDFSGPATAAGALTVTSVEGGATVSIAITATDATDAFSFLGFYDTTRDEPAEVTSAATVYPIAALNGHTLTVVANPGAISLTAALGVPEAAAASAAALAVLLNANAALTTSGTRRVQYIGTTDEKIKIRTVAGGATASLDVDAGVATAGVDVGFVTATNDTDSGAVSVGNADDTGADGLKTSELIFYLDDNPYAYDVVFDSNSLQDAIDEVNTLVNGSADVATEDARKLVLTSLLAGAASEVRIDATSTADTILGITGSDTGAGRPDPDFYLDGDGAVHVGPNILRNRSSGIPFSPASSEAGLYISYTALRKDVTASAVVASLLTFDTEADMEAAIGPVRTTNPLALGTFLALANAPGVAVSALGVDEASDAAPEGTLDGWVRALSYLESKEVYGVAPLTADEYVLGLVAAHVDAMAAPMERGERIAFIWTPMPTRAVTATVASGTGGDTNGTDDSFTLDVNPNSGIIAQGIDPSDTIDADENLYLELVVTTLGVSALRRYSVSDVDGVILTLRTTFADGENEDGFFTTVPLTEELADADWSLRVRGDALLITGTQIPDLNARAAAAASQAESYASRRVYYLACDSVDTSIDGLTTNVEGYYAAAAIVGMVAKQPGQQGFSLFPIGGLGHVYGTDDTFSERQMDVVADGGRYVLVNQGTGSVAARKQLSTSTTSVETKELSITKAIDKLAKGLRATNRVYIGRSVITSGFLDTLTMVNQGYLRSVGGGGDGLVENATLQHVIQDTTAPDTVLIEVEVTPVYPCNKIKITIVT